MNLILLTYVPCWWMYGIVPRHPLWLSETWLWNSSSISLFSFYGLISNVDSKTNFPGNRSRTQLVRCPQMKASFILLTSFLVERPALNWGEHPDSQGSLCVPVGVQSVTSKQARHNDPPIVCVNRLQSLMVPTAGTPLYFVTWNLASTQLYLGTFCLFSPNWVHKPANTHHHSPPDTHTEVIRFSKAAVGLTSQHCERIQCFWTFYNRNRMFYNCF